MLCSGRGIDTDLPLINQHLQLLDVALRHDAGVTTLQFEIVAVLGLISLFTHMHIFWVAGLLLAMIDLPDFGTPMRSIADSVEKIADATQGEASEAAQASPPPTEEPGPAKARERGHV